MLMFFTSWSEKSPHHRCVMVGFAKNHRHRKYSKHVKQQAQQRAASAAAARARVKNAGTEASKARSKSAGASRAFGLRVRDQIWVG